MASLKQQYQELETKRLKLCAERAAKPELESEIEEIERQQEAIASDIQHVIAFPGDYE